MPFKSEKQRKWMHANHPEMAKKWEKKEKMKKETKVKSLIKKMVREIMDEGKLIETVTKLTEKMTDKQIKQMRDKFMKTGKLPPHLKKLADLMDKHKDVKNIVVPGLEWMSDIKEGKLTEVSTGVNVWYFYKKANKDKNKFFKMLSDFRKKHSDTKWIKMLNYALEDFNENPKKYKTIDDKQNILFKNLQNNKKVYEGKLTEKIKDKKLQKAIDDLYKSVVQFGKHPSVRKNQKIIAGLIVPMTQGIVKMEKQLGEGKLTEAISGADRKILFILVREIVRNLKSQIKNFDVNNKSHLNRVGSSILAIIRAMSYSPDNVNYKNFKKYFPKGFNSKLIQKKLKQFHSQNDKVQVTLVTQAIKNELGEGVKEGKLNETWKPIAKKNVKYKDKTGTYNWEIESGIDTWAGDGNVPKIILHYTHEDEEGYPMSGGNTFWLKHKNGKPYTPQEAKKLVNKISNKKIHDFQRKSTKPSGSGQNIYYVDGKFIREGKLTEVKFKKVILPNDMKTKVKVSKMIKQLKLKIDKDYDVKALKARGGDQVISILPKHYNKFIELAMQNKLNPRG